MATTTPSKKSPPKRRLRLADLTLTPDLSDVRKDLESLAETLPTSVSSEEAWNEVSEAAWSAFEEMKRDHPLPPSTR